MSHKAGFVTIIGNPNVGKSTLSNAWVGERLSIITNKAQTTRHRILGIINDENFQIVLSDTPGILKPAYRLQEAMMDSVKGALQDADILVYMIEYGEKEITDLALRERLQTAQLPVLLLINKIDLGDAQGLDEMVNRWKTIVPQAEIYPLSAKTGFGVSEIFQRLLALLPIHPPYFPKDQFTDKPERFFVNEIIREKILLYYQKEIPYSVEVETEEFIEEEQLIRIRAVIMVERDSQKGIIIGHKGAALKKVGTQARMDMQRFFGKQIFLEVFVKVNKDWRKDDRQLRRFGYQ